MLARSIRRLGHEALSIYTLEGGLSEAESQAFDVVCLDVYLPDGNGLEALPRIQEVASQPEVLILTGAGDANGAELAIKSGAWDYIAKSASVEGMTLPLVRALEYRKQKLSTEKRVAIDRKGIIGEAPCMKRCYDLLAQAAGSNASVLITGETGTGKELFARAVHQNSSRHQGDFVVVDCTSLPETLVECVLFGHERGAFTGADRSQVGLIKQADGGTLFLDEVGELPRTSQKSFLRALQEKRFRPVGASAEVASDFRLVAATNRDLDDMVGRGEFRQDLVFRLRSLTVELPPLRGRKEDIRPLALHFVTQFCNAQRLEAKGFSPDFIDALFRHDWPGNVRELANTIEGAVASAGAEPILYAKHLPRKMRARLAHATFDVPVTSPKDQGI